jgi:hypothetical protein
MPSANEAAEPASPPGIPSEGVRTVVSLLLFIHIFVVWLAIMTSSESGGPQLLRDIKETGLDSYLTQFWLDRGYDYYLMNDQNWDFRLEATVNYADGHSDSPVLLPEANLWPRERRERYQELAGLVAQNIARAAGPDAREIDVERKSLLPKSIGGSLLRQHPGAESVSLKCIFHRGISREELRSENPKDNDPFNPQFFTTTSDMSIVMDHDEPTVFENLTPLEVSPVRRSNEQTSKQAAPSSSRPNAPARSGN